MDIIAGLQNKNNTEAYQLLLLLEKESAESDGLYAYLDDFLGFLDSKSPFVRVRGFRLACAQAPWDGCGRLDASLDRLLTCMENEKPTAIRQCLAALQGVLRYKPHLHGRILEKLDAMDLTRYKESMRPLLEKDIAALRNQTVS